MVVEHFDTGRQNAEQVAEVHWVILDASHAPNPCQMAIVANKRAGIGAEVGIR